MSGVTCFAVRLLLAFGILGLAAFSSAERLIYIPTAHKILNGTVKYELRSETGKHSRFENYLGVGVGDSWEFEVRSQGTRLDNQVGTVDVTYNLISPITGITPGFAFGVQDIADQTSSGPRPFFVTTFRDGYYVAGGEVPGEVTVGITSEGRRIYPLVGVSIPFSKRVRFLGENDGIRNSIGAEYRPMKDFALRAIVRNRTTLLGFQLSGRF
ncbi:hypothetical protein BH11ARM1_BH11ARM1_01420 [soil metagenome]